LQKLRGFDAAGARSAGKRQADPRHALSYANLAAIWNHHYDQKAADAAKRPDLSAGLRHEERLRVEGQYHEVSHEWDKAVAKPIVRCTRPRPIIWITD
jgi:hypothetical protein